MTVRITDSKISEAALCATFLAAVVKRRGWTAYPETAGFDILLVRDDGAQIGIQAKLRLNAKVVCQIMPDGYSYGVTGPDYRAVLVPRDKAGELGEVCSALGITVIRQDMRREGWDAGRFYPALPLVGNDWNDERAWHQWMPLNRSKLPDYVQDVAAGTPCPITLTAWKIKAIKLAIIMEERPITRADFKALMLDPKRWLDLWSGWLARHEEGGFVPGKGMPDFKREHPINYEQIRADRAKWMPAPVVAAKQREMAL